MSKSQNLFKGFNHEVKKQKANQQPFHQRSSKSQQRNQQSSKFLPKNLTKENIFNHNSK